MKGFSTRCHEICTGKQVCKPKFSSNVELFTKRAGKALAKARRNAKRICTKFHESKLPIPISVTFKPWQPNINLVQEIVSKSSKFGTVSKVFAQMFQVMFANKGNNVNIRAIIKESSVNK